ncbi:hypothetical protein ABZP36_025960, partial [Zizania latifolia]
KRKKKHTGSLESRGEQLLLPPSLLFLCCSASARSPLPCPGVRRARAASAASSYRSPRLGVSQGMGLLYGKLVPVPGSSHLYVPISRNGLFLSFFVDCVVSSCGLRMSISALAS